MRKSSFASENGLLPLKTIAIPSPAARAVIINLPGYRGDIHGFNGKYDKIGAMLAARDIGAFVQMPNRMHEFNDDFGVTVDDLSITIRAASREAREMCATQNADIYLIGASAGGAAVAMAAGRFPQVKKILLVAPALYTAHSYYNALERSIESYPGEISIVVGEDDEVTGPDAARKYYELARYAKKKRFKLIPDCGHQFMGERNGMILSKAPLWAFAGDTSFPSPDGGQKIYT